ncbi:MAG: PEP-CTERM sorting domain-containing protein [Nitrospirota bacterium]|jgi:hypothetical protein
MYLKTHFGRIKLLAIILGLTFFTASEASATPVTFDFSGFEVIEAFEGTEGTETATLAGSVSLGDSVSGSLEYDSDTGQLNSVDININDAIFYSGPPASAYQNVQVQDNVPYDSFEVVTTHSLPLSNLTLPSGVTDNLVYLQAGLSLFNTDGSLYSGTSLPAGLNLDDFDWGRVHLWTWFPDLDGDGIGNTAWRIFADYHSIGTTVPEPSTLLLFGSGLFGLGAFRKKFKK